MSEQSETWRTDPRERLIAAIDSTWAYGELGATPEQLVDAYAHELAEQIRADILPELDEYGTREQQAEIDGRRGAADLVDPYVGAG